MIGHDFPYLDTRDLNLDWLIKNMKQILLDWAEYQQTMNQSFADLEAANAAFKQDMTAAFNNLHNFVDDYFENLNVQTEINNKLNSMKETGELAEIMSPLIASETSTWLSTHITNPSNPPIDTSLTVAGAAADAKATGDEITGLKRRFGKLIVSPFNIFDKNDVVSGYLNGSGNILPSDSYKTSQLIDVSIFDTLTFSFTSFGGWFDSSAAFISPLNTSEMNSLREDKSIAVPSSAKYIRVTVETANLDRVQVGENVTRTDYISNEYYSLINLILDSGQIDGDEYLKTELGLKYINLFNKNNVVSGYLNNNGNILANDDYRTSLLIDITGYDTLTFSYTDFGGWYDADEVFISPLVVSEMSTITEDKTIAVPANAKYLRVTVDTANLDKVQVGQGVTRSNYMSSDLYRLIRLRLDSAQIYGSEYLRKELGFENINLFNKNEAVDGYLNNSGNILPSDSYKTSQLIDVTNFDTLRFSYTNFGGWFNESGTLIPPLNTAEMNSLSEDKSIEIPADAKYIRVVVETANLDRVQVGEFADRDDYIANGVKYLKNVVTPSDEAIKITVDKNGGGDYTSLTEALYDNIADRAEVTVNPGSYDIIAEYKAFFGNSTFINMGNSTNLNGFQNGIVLRNKKIHFMPGASVVCDWTTSGHDATVASNFSPFRVDYNVEIEGLYLVCKGTYYGIHDDYGNTEPYEVVYKNCVIIGTNLSNKNCIGGGCKAYSRHILENCYFANGESAETDLVLSCCVRYHNTNAAGAVPEVHVSNCYFETNFNACYYGQQTTKMRVYVNNCRAPKGINKIRESSTMNVDNVDLFEWCNDES